MPGHTFLRLQTLWEPFGITRHDTDGRGTYERHGDAETQTVGKAPRQRIESKLFNVQMRIERLRHRTLCLSKTEWMHDRVSGWCVNRYEFGRAI